jgi:hypothetical protein
MGQIMPDKTQDMLEIEAEIWDEFGSSNWISGKPASQAVLMAAKQEHRLGKNKSFNGFVLEQKSLDDSEFTQFIHQLKTVASDIPSGTRIQLAVLTHFVDPDYEWSADYEEGKRTCAHWTAVDLVVKEDGKISSFVLDAANAQGFQRMHARLKETFPEGEHYVYIPDLGATGRNSPIQTQTIGCRVFAIEHLKQLSQINTATLYNNELPEISNPEGQIKASNFTGGLKLTRIFRGMQTWTGLQRLPEAMKNTPIKDTSPETVIQYAEKQSVVHGGFKPVKTNETISRRNLKYINKKRDFYHALSPEMQQNILENRTGLTYLQHPQLFKLSDMLASIDASEDKDALIAFVQELAQALENHDTVAQLTALSDTQSSGAIKQTCLVSIIRLYRDLDASHSVALEDKLSRKIEQLYQRTTQNPTHRYRNQLQDSDTSCSESDDNSYDDSPRGSF